MACFQHLCNVICQLRHVWHSVHAESAATLVHTFVTLRVDCCNAILTEAPMSVANKLQWVLNAAARIVSETRKYDHGLFHLHKELHQCLQSRATQYLMECCIPLYNITCRQHLRSASCHQLFIPGHQHSMFGRRAFSVAGLMAWNLLPDTVCDLTFSFDSFRCDLKNFFCLQCIRCFVTVHYINSWLTLTVTLTFIDKRASSPSHKTCHLSWRFSTGISGGRKWVWTSWPRLIWKTAVKTEAMVVVMVLWCSILPVLVALLPGCCILIVELCSITGHIWNYACSWYYLLVQVRRPTRWWHCATVVNMVHWLLALLTPSEAAFAVSHIVAFTSMLGQRSA